MKALTCPKCGAPLQSQVTVCPYCRVGLVADESPKAAPETHEQPPAEIPESWTSYQDPWHGFSIGLPPGWQVVTQMGQISIRQDPAGLTAALIWPFSLQAPGHARQVAQQLIGLARAGDPTFQAWQQDNAAPDSDRITLKTRQVRFGQQIEGVVNILVNGLNVIVSGFAAPVEAVGELSQLMARVLATFRTQPLMPRQVFREPAESAFTVNAPQGWSFQGGVNRNNIGGAGSTRFSISRDPQGQVAAVMPNFSWTYMDGLGGFLSGMGGYPSMRFLPAAQFARQSVAPWMGQSQQGLKIERIDDRPDLAEAFYADLAQSGYPPAMYEVTVASLETSSSENGVQIRQKSRVFTQRQRPAGALMGGTPLWMAGLDVYLRAPAAEYPTWEPVLSGILESFRLDPNWKMGEQRLSQNFIANSQMDIRRRTQQISQTLSETSDIISNSYWNQQATYDRLSEMRSNATLGVQDVASAAGDVYKVPYGYDQYWVDGLGDLYGGSWMAQPDINWTPLNPTGV